MNDWTALIRDVPDFPKPGIVFKDITPVLADAAAFAATIEAMAAAWRGQAIDAVVGIEARGFILGAPLARALGAGFVPVRKPGKLPGRTLSQAYALEYGEDRLELHADALPAGARVLLVDDVLATGGTLAAACALLGQLQVDLAGAAVLIELAALNGRERWNSALPLHASLVI
ncbi:MAG: adenine phosphoribosyltransferase [Propionibacteriaceae bacterium]|nr:adenine phosphoribosyltransferase [Propionibacteriaceae bacterium]